MSSILNVDSNNNARLIAKAVPTIAQAAQVQPWKVDASRGSNSGRVSSEWYRRPDDQRFLSLDDLYDYTKHTADVSSTMIEDVRKLRVVADPGDALKLSLQLAGGEQTKLTNWSFGQACALTKAPASYLRELPGTIAGINLQYGIATYSGELVKVYKTQNGCSEVRAFTSPDYGRIFDHEIVSAVQRIAGDGIGETNWKVPGVMDWGTMQYNPNAIITKQSTTLFASDRDVFLFLVDDQHPIEIGKLASGEPDLVFRGFYVWNSEVGARTFGIAMFYLRGVCQNRCLWGIEGFKEMSFRHSKFAPDRFAAEIRPTLDQYSKANTARLIEGVKTVKGLKVASSDDEATEFLARQKLAKPLIEKVLGTVLNEEGHAARSIWDMVQGITAVARTVPHQDERVALERVAGRLLDKAA